jgi:hypothetical protein
VIEYRELRKIFGSTSDNVAVTGDWRRLHNEGLHDLYSSSNNMWVIKSRKIIWTGQMARMGDSGSLYRVMVGKSEDPYPGVDGKGILEDGMCRARKD